MAVNTTWKPGQTNSNQEQAGYNYMGSYGSSSGYSTPFMGSLTQATPDPQSPPAPQQQPGGGGGQSTPAPVEDPNAFSKATMIAMLRDFMSRNGMGELLGAMEYYVKQGYTGDAIWVMTKNDANYQAAYNKRFAGNAERAKKGLSELLPSTYIELEQGYRTAMLNRRMPSGLFDSTDDFTNLIANDVSVKEVAERLDVAQAYINDDSNKAVNQQLRDIYGMTNEEMAAYVLNPEKTLDYLNRESSKNLRRASVGGAAVNAGVGVSGSIRDEIADLMSTYGNSAYSQSTQGFNQVAADTPLYQKLAKLSDETGTQDELTREQFGLNGAADVTNKKKVLASQERARFGGSSGLGATSLSAGRRAQ